MSSDDWVKIAEIASPIIAFVGLFFIWWQLYSNAQQHRRERAFHFAGKYHDPEYVKYFVNAMSFMRSDFPTWQEYRNNSNIKINVGVTMNYFEELGLMYRENLIDRRIIDYVLADPIIESFKLFEWLINRMRQEQIESNPELLEQFLCYKHWEKMCSIIDQNYPIYIKEVKRREYLKRIMPLIQLTR